MSSGEFTKVPVLNKESIIVGSNLIRDFLPKDITVATPKTTKYVIITDTAVHSLHFGHLLQALHAAGISSDRIYPYTVPVGEQTKSREQKACIEDWMLGNECNRDTCIIALGGGVVGDLSGFVASTYLRGIPFIQIPTTLLAMVDSSIGGKTGINTTKAKNLIGAIYQPVRIYIDITFLQTLPKRQIANGMAEVIKTFAIRNEEMFSVLEESYDKVFDPAANQDVLYKIIVECVKIKAHVVTIDETEAGLRTLLNFGHTIGHAIESVCMEFMLHGECVAIGMVKEAEIARELGHLAPSAVARLASCIRAYSLPIAIPAQGSATEVLMEKMALDKKNVGGKKRCVLLTKIGATLNDVAQLVDDSILLKSISKPIVVIPPSSPIQGSIRVPGSKSISNRVLLLAAMGEGECRIGGLLHSDDTQVMMNALKLLGAAEFRYEKSQNPHDTEPVLVVKGNGGKMVAPPSGKHLYLGNAGTATRFLATLCTLVGVYAPSEKKDLQKVVLTGDKRMCERPIKDLVVALKQHQDCSIRYLGTDGCPPLEIDGTGLRGGKIELAADVSSQFVSSILLSSPYANTPVTLSLDPHKEVVSQPYIDMTVSLMRDFGVNVEVSADKRTYTIPKQPYKNPAIVDVESDASSSTYPLVFAAITGGKVTALNVTSKSLQGDAQFCRVLEKMGCTVSQDEHKTTVEGPAEGQLRGVDYNMGDLTDAFMGVACLAAVAKGTTRITGIANQRVKECNRIQVTVEELTKLGVKCRELEDGVEVEGMPLSAFKAGAIECYNDHRIAMSFACLGCKVPNITIKDKECVQKTYPEFWDDLTNAFGVKLTTPKIEAKAESAPQTGKPQRVIIIGMRGAGKTSQGRVAAGALGYPFVDLDEYFEKISEPNNIKTFVEQKGWDQFRLQELKVFQQALSEYEGKPVIISCGGGIVETEPARKVLLDLAKVKDTHIIFFQRHIDDIAEYLIEKDKVRPAFAEHPTTVYGRRFENYRRCSTHEFVINKGDEDWHAIEREFIDFVSQITGQETRKFVAPSASNVEHDLGSFFICLTFPDYLDSQKVSKKDVEVLSEGVHAIEFRADLLDSPDGLNVELLGKQHAALRRKNTHRLPLIFTIRSVSHGGSFAGNEDTLFSLLEQGVRYGVEYLDVESTWSKSSLAKIVSLKEKNPSSFKIISSYHCYDPKIWEDDSKITAMFDLCYFSKSVDVVKVVVNATEANVHGTRIHRLADQWRERNPGVPTIVLCTGEKGKIARVLNRFLTPVTHPILPAKAAPGQMSVQEIHLARHSLGFIPKGNFYLFGSPISQSRSPLIHNTGFKILGLPHQYHICETLDVSEIQKKIRDPSTFGASVTIPHKLDVIPLVDKLSEHAKRIGAVNTIYKVPTKEGTWEVWGDNTDYLGVKGLLTARLGKEKPLNALVLGAGGTSRAVLYALNRMNAEGYRITKQLYNRSTDKARDLAAEFDCNVITTLESSDETCPYLVISTLPPAAQNEIFSGDLGRFAWMFQKGQLALDLVYRPRETPVLKLAKSHNVKYLIEGIEVLLEQGYAQFCIWTGTRAAPTNEIREIVMASL